VRIASFVGLGKTVSGAFLWRLRCQWCGRYIAYTMPTTSFHPLSRESELCEWCDRIFPMPSWQLDSPEGRLKRYSSQLVWVADGYPGEDYCREFEAEFGHRSADGSTRSTAEDGGP
jgi:hypothetical protein